MIDDAMLHRLWGKAVGTSGYVKSEWQQLEKMLHSAQTLAASPQEPLQPFRTDARTTDRIEKLETVREAARAFLLALDTDPGYPFKRQEALRAALEQVEA